MPVPNSWICSGCWKPNRMRDTRCFQCRLPRDADPALIQRQVALNAARAAVPDPVPDIFVSLPAILFRWEAKILLVLGGILFVILFLDALTGAPEWQLIPAAVVMVACVVCGVLFRGLAAAMEDRNPWGFFGAALVAGLFTAAAAYQLFVLPAPLGIPVQAATIRSWVTLILSSAATLCAFSGLVMIAIRGQAPR